MAREQSSILQAKFTGRSQYVVHFCNDVDLSQLSFHRIVTHPQSPARARRVGPPRCVCAVQAVTANVEGSPSAFIMTLAGKPS